MKPALEQTLVSVTLPEMGESVTQGSIVEWRKRVGEYVAEGDPLVEVTTDKVDVEVPATASGVVTKILAREGQTVAVGAALAEIDSSKSGGAVAAAPGNGAKAPPPQPSPAPRAAPPSDGEPLADAPARRIAERLGARSRAHTRLGTERLDLAFRRARSSAERAAHRRRRPFPQSPP